ncbi:hypothetical protein ABBQ38_002960 [Trebouxia sp. C0009 RCD-2024]
MSLFAFQQEVPFAHPLPHYPVSKEPRLAPSFADKKETPPPHIPTFLPAFPDKHTYVQTAAYAGHEHDPKQQRLAADKARRQAEKSLVKLHDRSMPPPPPPKLAPGGAKPPQLKLPASMGPPPPRQKQTNPFLAAPLWEDQSRSVPPPGSAVQNNISYPEHGAEFGDEEEEEDAATAMEGVTADLLTESAEQWSEWQSIHSTDSSAAAPSTIPFSMDLANSMRQKAVSSRLQRAVPDAFAATDEDGGGAHDAGRAPTNQRSKKSQRDPSLQQAEQILAAGSDALTLQQ